MSTITTSCEKEILFYTGNKGKYNEIKTEFAKHNLLTPNNKHKYHYKLTQVNVDIPEIQSTSNEEVVKHKLNWIIKHNMTSYDIYTKSVMVEDTGLYITNDIMNGFPGALIKYYLEHLKNDGICKLNGGSSAEATTYIGLWDSSIQKDIYFKGTVSGKIAVKPSGTNGFGYDPAFVPLFLNDYDYFTDAKSELLIRQRNTENYTFADLDDDKKAQTNMRTICASRLCNYIKFNYNKFI